MSKNEILKSLEMVIYPGFKKSVVEFGFVKNIDEKNGEISLEIPSNKPEVSENLRREIGKILPNFKVLIKTPQIPDEPKPAKNNIAPTIRHFVMVSSGKGGVGKSTTTLNLAISAAKLGKRVGLLDADIYGPNIPRMMGETGKKPQLKGERIEPILSHGIKMISMGVLVDAQNAILWRGAMIMGAIKQLLTDVDWGELDILFIDMPPGTGDAQITLAQSVPVSAGVCVTTPQVVALDDTARSLDMFVKLHIPIAGIVENMSGFLCPDNGKEYAIFGKGGSERLAREFQTEILAEIPIEMEIRECGDEGRPVSFYHPNSLSAQRFETAAIRLNDFLDLIEKNNLADNSQIQPR